MKRYLSVALMLLFSALFSLAHADFYWENAVPLSKADCHFPRIVSYTDSQNNTVEGGIVIWQEAQKDGKQNGRIYLSAEVQKNGISWIKLPSFAGPFSYSGEIPDIYSAAVDNKGRLAVAVLSGTNTISVFTTDIFKENTDSSASETVFEEFSFGELTQSLVAPRIFSRSDGSFILFATQVENETFTLMHAVSSDGKKWSDFKPFEPAVGLQNVFIPELVKLPDGDLVIFQLSYSSGLRLSYQLYASKYSQSERRWQPAHIVTDRASYDGNFTSWHNQRANLLFVPPEKSGGNGKLYLAWERMYYSSENSGIYFGELDTNGFLINGSEQLSSGGGSASHPELFMHDGKLSVLWFDNRRGVSNVYMAQKDGILWNETAMTNGRYNASFALPYVASNGDLNVFWQQADSKKHSVIQRLSPDRTVQKPSVKAVSYKEGKRSSAEKVTVKVYLPDDSSGIAGFSYSWSQNPAEEPPEVFMNLPEQTSVKTVADNDGLWYFKARVLDYAGNWSSSTYITYERDRTPPAPPLITPPLKDEYGFLSSNTFSAGWEAPEDDDVAGYTYSFEYMDVLPDVMPSETEYTGKAPALPPARLMTTKLDVSFRNADDGIYAFSVAAIDSVGNIGKPAVSYFYLNKYIPYTWITSVNAKANDFGDVSVSILGRGYTKNGTVNEIYISKDGKAPYDRVLTLANKDYTVNSDRRISGITLSDLEEGSYRIGLLHPDRGLYWSGRILTISEFGTVKLGDYTHTFKSPFEPLKNAKYAVSLGIIAVLLTFMLLITSFFVSMRGIISAAKDSVAIRHEVQALIEGDTMPMEKKMLAENIKHKGVSLKYKLVFFTSTLVLVVVLLVSIPLGFYMIRNQEKTLAGGLNDRVEVLMESLASGVKTYMPSQNVLELSFLPDQISAVKEAVYSTIIGLSSDGNSTSIDYLWATNDESIADKIDTKSINFGKSRITEETVAAIAEKCSVLNEKASEKVSEIAAGITRLNAEGIALASKSDAASQERLAEIQTITRQLSEKLTAELTALSYEGAGSYPEYSNTTLSRDNTTYLFYKPVLYRQGAEQNFVRGIVLLEISTAEPLQSLGYAEKNVIFIAVAVALVAILLGLLGSLILSSYILRPIKKLASHVAMIRDTEDKEELEGKDIIVKSHDEIGLLGETVNDMTHGLIKAAAAAKDLTVGKEVQKMFIPLEVDSHGRKLTTGKIDDDRTEFFGYYEGAKGVSGDYFDYLKLDDKNYAMIKCDVSGKGVPAALIMVEVATLFLHYFKDWSYKKNGYNLTPVVSQINDLIEARGFKGRFAAFTLCIYNSETGDLYFCNAGDNLIHIYDSETGKKNTITLPESAAAGVFPTFMVDMKGGFKVSKLHLKPGDVLFLYTDGIEEAKRLFRDENLNLITCQEPGLAPESPHGYHTVGQDGEEMAPERVNAIIEAVFHRKTFKLEKFHNPIPNEELVFDFSTCNGTAEEVIMALVSVEKIFRMYKNPAATDFDIVQVDAKIDAFLNEHFLQYNEYCSHRKPHPQYEEYKYYTRICEDVQYDDLTLIAIRRKK